MGVKFLGVCSVILKALRREKERLTRLYSAIDSLGRELDGLPRGSVTIARTEKLATSIVDAQKAIGDLATGYLAAVVELAAVLEYAVGDDATRRVLFLRYGLCKYFRDIGFELCYSERRVYQLHSEGLETLQLHFSW